MQIRLRAASLCVEVAGTSSVLFLSFSSLSFDGSSFTLTGVLGGEAHTYTPDRQANLPTL